MNRSRILAAAASVALIAGTAVVAASPAYADAGNCPSGRACVWKDTSYKTAGSGTNYVSFGQYIWGYYRFSWSSGQGNVNDNVTSLYNAGNFEKTRWYRDILGGGPYFTLSVGKGDSNLADSSGNGGSGHNDWISSAYFESFYP